MRGFSQATTTAKDRLHIGQAVGAKAYRPLLQIAGYTEDFDPLPGWHTPEEPQAASADGGKEPVPYANEMDDSIPF